MLSRERTPNIYVVGITIKVAGQILEGKEIDGRTWASVRALTEALGKTVAWDGATRTVTIS
ncbi:copper amine oxidase N-terminal domain-containing protein [Pelotomaculum terephthalicicum JT]|uniref:stalk domain-containing protein n=1 Tax=Pelotomaculum TaxID=191373 RepID=UPI001F044870|nr:stalk domain-containing protein [Pelotomaculum terephthalicicum]MCG9969575.1 copper amine oxidase N-terminal domain-containing protein [Pelotomaculum terephthalicicum JT]